MIALREGEGLDIKFIIQVDTLCHKIKNFIDKATRAGVNRVFIVLENINPEDLLAAKKRQNKITEYRDMLQAWRERGATQPMRAAFSAFRAIPARRSSRDIAIIRKERLLDLLEFFFLTPLPGSEDHRLYTKGEWMDPDLNKYDLNHPSPITARCRMRSGNRSTARCGTLNYSPEHIETVLKRAAAHPKGRPGNKLFLMLWFYLMVKYEGVHPLEVGYFRLKRRRNRHSGLPLENPLIFYPCFVAETIRKHLGYGNDLLLAYRRYRRVKKDPNRRADTDRALSTSGRTGDIHPDLGRRRSG